MRLTGIPAAIREGDDVLVVAVVLHPDPEWQRVGELARE